MAEWICSIQFPSVFCMFFAPPAWNWGAIMSFDNREDFEKNLNGSLTVAAWTGRESGPIGIGWRYCKVDCIEMKHVFLKNPVFIMFNLVSVRNLDVDLWSMLAIKWMSDNDCRTLCSTTSWTGRGNNNRKHGSWPVNIATLFINITVFSVAMCSCNHWSFWLFLIFLAIPSHTWFHGS